MKKYFYRFGQSLFCLNQVENVGFDVGIIAETINYGFSLNQRTIKSEYNRAYSVCALNRYWLMAASRFLTQYFLSLFNYNVNVDLINNAICCCLEISSQ